MYSDRGDAALPAPGFPIRASAGQSLFSGSPRLIAAVHALLRLQMPRHPPCALHILTVISSIERRSALVEPVIDYFDVVWPTVRFSRSGGRRAERTSRPRSLKTQQRAGGPEGRAGPRSGRRLGITP